MLTILYFIIYNNYSLLHYERGVSIMESAYYSDTAFAGILVIVYLITMLI